MKIFRWTAAAMATALLGSIGCSTGGCQGTNLNSNNSNVPTVTCGEGTTLVNGVCVLVTPTKTR